MTDVTQRGIRVKSADTLTIENRLRNTEPGDVVSYDDLSTLLGRDVRMYCRGNLGTARKTLVDESIFFDVLPNAGLKRLNTEEACEAASSYTRRARKTARRGIRHLQHVQFDELSDDGKRKHLTTSAQLGAMEMFGAGKAAKRIEKRVNGQRDQLPIGETLKLFGG
jgi:hypothetical protein